MADVRDFRLPDLGEGLEEGEIVSWHVEVGDFVELNETVCDVETAKAIVAVPSPFAGRVVERVGDVGESLAVGTVILRLDVGVEGGRVADAAGDEGSEGAGDGGTDGGADDDTLDQPLVGYGEGRAGGGRRRRRRGRTGTDGDGQPRRPMAKPPVRKLARDLGVELEAIMPGSGEGGIITREDVRAAAGEATRPAAGGPEAGEPATTGPAAGGPGEGATTGPAGAPAAGAAGAAVATSVEGFRGRRPGEVEQIRGIRRRIVDQMETSRREIPEASCSREVDVTELWALRRRLTDQARAEGHEVTITPFAMVLRAAVLALRRFPTLNARLDTEADTIELLEPIHLGFAADTDRGLIVPVIRDAHTRSLLQLAGELGRLAERARDGSISPGELTGGTFTVNNYGAFGNDDGEPIINHPEAGILGVGAMRERPWAVDGQVRVRRTCTLRLAFDHRICDGGEAGRFVTYVADLCEDPARLLLHA